MDLTRHVARGTVNEGIWSRWCAPVSDPPRFVKHEVSKLYSVAHLFPKAKRCGIYILGFSNGERYVGQSVNVVTRFGMHRRRWDDIDELLFSPCPRAELDAFEQRMIRAQRGRHPLRNITHALGPLGESDLDPIVAPDEQYAWLNEDAELADVQVRADDPEQRKKYRTRYCQLEKSPYFGFVAFAVNVYVQFTIPKPRQTERTFWSLSALPSTNRNRFGGRLATLSVNKMETLFLFSATDPANANQSIVGGRMNVSRSALEAAAGPIDDLRENYPMLGFDIVDYESAGGDGLLITFGAADYMTVLELPGWQHAAQQLNLTLMRKGPTFQWRWHCYDLADWAVRDLLTVAEVNELLRTPK